jgi:hypothetical protein
VNGSDEIGTTACETEAGVPLEVEDVEDEEVEDPACSACSSGSVLPEAPDVLELAA